MLSYRKKQVLKTVVIILVSVGAVIGLIFAARFLFFNTTTSETKNNENYNNLTSTTAGRAVEMSVRGPIVADEDFRSYNVKITPNSRELTVYRGYQKTEINHQTLTNNVEAYHQFVFALNAANLLKDVDSDGGDSTGVCATGYIYTFIVSDDGNEKQKIWGTTCSSKSGSLKAQITPLKKLFITQLTENEQKIINNIW